MQIPTHFLIGAMALACMLPQAVRAQDSEAQAKARTALRQIEAGKAPAASAPATPPPASAPAAPPMTAEGQEEKLRNALHQTMGTGQSTAPATPSVPAPAATATAE